MNHGWARFSHDKKYRYLLGRRIGDSPRRILFIMLNPATADETQNDPTIRRCIGFAKQWEFGTCLKSSIYSLSELAYVSELRKTRTIPVGRGK